jgi:hypothetical protein
MSASEIEPRRAEETTEEKLEAALMRQLSICPITREPFRKPVFDPDGFNNEKSAIVKWVTENGTSPMTRKSLSVDQLVPNRSLMALIEQLRELSRSNRTKRHGTFQVFVVSIDLDNRTYVIDTDPSEKVSVLKKTISSKTGLRRFRLLWGCKQLEDERTLADYNMHRFALIHYQAC